MKDSNLTNRFRRHAHLAEQLRAEAQRIPVRGQAGLVAQVMRNVRASPKMVEGEVPGSETAGNASGWMPWLMAGTTAAALVIVVIAVTLISDESSTSTLQRQASLPRIVESRVDPVLASREQDLAGELKRIRADLHSIGRMVSIRLESDSD